MVLLPATLSPLQTARLGHSCSSLRGAVQGSREYLSGGRSEHHAVFYRFGAKFSEFPNIKKYVATLKVG